MPTSSNNIIMAMQRELGSISQALKTADEYRVEVLRRLDEQNGRSDELSLRLSQKIDDQTATMGDVKGALLNVETAVKSQSVNIASIAVEKCGDRLNKVEDMLKDYPNIYSEVIFWRRLLGGTFHAVWKLAVLLIGSGGVGALIVKYWPFH